MIYALTSRTFEATTTGAPAGLPPGTLGVTIVDPDHGAAVVVPRSTANIVEVARGVYTATLTAPAEVGDYLLIWDDGADPPNTAAEELTVTLDPRPPVIVQPVPEGATNIRVMVPRVRRALEGFADGGLTDDQVTQLTADAIAEVILYTGGVFGKELLVAERDAQGVPTEYATDEPLSLSEESVIAFQAALTHFYFSVRDLKVSESIANEGATWSYQLSANTIRDQIAGLQDARDRALEALQRQIPMLDRYVSFIEARDADVARAIEPWGAGFLA